MAFNYLGTLSLEQLNELRSFLQAQVEDIDEQINTLRIEANNAEQTRLNLILADGNLGGNASDSIFLTELPDIKKVPHQDDINSAMLIEKAKRAFIPNIKFKREKLEYKIKKMTDNVEQLREMIDRKAIAKTQVTELLSGVEKLFTAENANHLFAKTDDLKNYQKGIFTAT